ncbi:glycosyl hydrolase family 28-related protein [Cohnella sp.]|uniref:glycosyl hydrolase family 28-related protein n=1 Tax=Cohnella sp. TaxID=1883426 RepID=UPI00356B5BEE
MSNASSIVDFGAVGDGVANDTKAIQNAMASDKSSIYFPEGRYNISANTIFPEEKTLIFDKNAYLYMSQGIKLTVNSKIIAAPFPLFAGEGTVISDIINKRTIKPQWFGASNEGDEKRGIVSTKASFTQGSNLLSIPETDKFRYWDGQTVMVLHGGSNITSTFPNPAPQPTLSKFGTAGSTTYRYRIAILDKYGGITSASAVTTITNAPDILSFKTGNKIRITMPVGGSRHGYAIYGEESNPANSRGILGLIRDVTAYWEDGGHGSIAASTPPWIPLTAPNVKLNNILVTTIVSGGGTTTLTLKDNAGATLNGNGVVMMDNADAYNKSYNYLETCGGGTIEVDSGVYHFRLDPATARSVYFTSNITTKGINKPLFLMHVNPCNDNMYYFVSKGNSASHWSFEGIIWDGGNRTYTTEFAQLMINPLGTKGHSYFLIKDCEFRYFRGKFISTYDGNCSDYRITGNHFHHGCSNALGIGGHRYRVDNNLFSDIFLGYGGTKVGGAEAIIMRSLTFGNTDVTSYGDISFNTFNNYGTINFGGAKYGYKHINISYNKILGYDNAIGLGGIMENINVIGNQIKIQSLGYLNGGNAIKLELPAVGQSCSDLNISDNAISIYSDPTTGFGSSGISFSVNPNNFENVKRVRITNNSINQYENVTQRPVELRYLKELIFSGNSITSDNPNMDTALDIATNNTQDHRWVITDNITLNKVVKIPSGSIVTANQTGLIRVSDRSIVTGNTVSGVPVSGANTWGAVIFISGSDNIVTNNKIDMQNHFNTSTAAINEGSGARNNVISGNQITNSTTNYPLLHNFESTVVNNTGVPNAGRREFESSSLPTKGMFIVGDRIINITPTAGGTIGWVCTTAGYAAESTWTAKTAYSLNKLVYSGTRVYKSTLAGTSGSAAPTHTSGSAIDGTVTWQFVGNAVQFKTFGTISS